MIPFSYRGRVRVILGEGGGGIMSGTGARIFEFTGEMIGTATHKPSGRLIFAGSVFCIIDDIRDLSGHPVEGQIYCYPAQIRAVHPFRAHDAIHILHILQSWILGERKP